MDETFVFHPQAPPFTDTAKAASRHGVEDYTHLLITVYIGGAPPRIKDTAKEIASNRKLRNPDTA